MSHLLNSELVNVELMLARLTITGCVHDCGKKRPCHNVRMVVADPDSYARLLVL